MYWARDISDFLDRRTGQLILPYDVLLMQNGLNSDVPVPPSTLLEISGPSGAFQIGGLAGGVLGRLIIIVNTTGQAMKINNMDAGSQLDNQINTEAGATVNATAALLVHGAVGQRWLLVAYT
jgi:hypothetical protein